MFECYFLNLIDKGCIFLLNPNNIPATNFPNNTRTLGNIGKVFLYTPRQWSLKELSKAQRRGQKKLKVFLL